MSRLHQMRAGRDNDPEFGSRMRGSGLFADLLEQRFRMACKRLGLNLEDRALDSGRFKPPARHGQMNLF